MEIVATLMGCYAQNSLIYISLWKIIYFPIILLDNATQHVFTFKKHRKLIPCSNF